MRLLLLAAFALVWGTIAAQAASVDPSRITAIDQAASDFLTRAAAARKTGEVPRQSDPAVSTLLETVFDTGDLRHGTPPYADLGKLDDWLLRIVAVGRVYIAAGRAVHDLGVFGAEIGRFVDAAIAVEQAITDCMTAELIAHPGVTLSPTDQRKLAQLRAAVTDTIGEMIDLWREPGLTVGWVRDRVTALIAAAPSLARFLTPEELARLRAKTLRLAAAIRDKPLRGILSTLAVGLAEPPPPAAAPAEAAAGSAEIALDSDGQSYSLPVRINGGQTVKFLLDSGASVVVLPSDLVETLTKSGAITAGDALGRDVYVTADGRKHRGTRLMLRQLDVGGHTVTNVIADVAPAKAEPLLGLSFLAKFRSWTLDNKRHVLVITE
jgi:clan AA aspartic protease (TIGR02281 family)